MGFPTMRLLRGSDMRPFMNEAESLRSAIAVSILTLVPALLFMYMAQRHLPRDEATRLERARTLGEPVDEQRQSHESVEDT